MEVNLKSSTLGWTPLHQAIFAGHANVVRYLVAQQADINAKSGLLTSICISVDIMCVINTTLSNVQNIYNTIEVFPN